MVSMENGNLVYENITDYLKNHWTKHRLVCTHSDAFFMLIPNMYIIFKVYENSVNFMTIDTLVDIEKCKSPGYVSV